MLKNVKSKFIEPDGTLNGRIISALIALLIVLVQQIIACFGIKFTGDWGSIINVINTILTILGLVGVVSEVSPVTNSENGDVK